MNEPKYIARARSQIGVKEIAGEIDQLQILSYFGATTFKASHDEVPWCAAFVCWCLENEGITATRSAWALSFKNWGTELKFPERYCIAIFKRNGGGHVGFVVGITDDNCLLILGGNQHNEVNITKFSMADAISYRRPPMVYAGVANA